MKVALKDIRKNKHEHKDKADSGKHLHVAKIYVDRNHNSLHKS